MIIITDNNLASIMSPSTITLGSKDSLNEVRNIFSNNNIHHIPVVDENGLIEGMVSIVDYAVALDPMTPFGNDQTKKENQKTFDSFIVEDIMAKNVISLLPEDDIQSALSIFKQNLFHAIPIVDKENKLLGIVTTYDLLMLIKGC